MNEANADQARPLPAGWRWVKLGEVCTQDRQIVEPSTDDARSLTYISLEHIEAETGLIANRPVAQVEDEGRSTTFRFDQRHVLYGKLRPYLNKVALPRTPGRCTTELIPLLPCASIERGFLAWVLRRTDTVYSAMQDKTGSRMPRADMNRLLNLAVPLPPVEEQRRIAAALKQQMAAVERARAAAHARLDAANALPVAYLRQAFPAHPASSSRLVPLGSISDVCSGVTLGRRLNGAPARSVPYLRVANVKDGRLDLADLTRLEATEPEIQKLRLERGDLLLTEGGDPDKLGRGTFWDGELPECIHQNHIYRARFDLSQVSPAYLAYQVGSEYGKAYFLKHAKRTTGIATINQRVLKAFPLVLPPIAEQRRVAAMLDDQMAMVENARAAVEAELDAINALSAALLRRAFAGEL